MSHPFLPHATKAAAYDSSLETSSLLTPPLTPFSEQDVPYRPGGSDQASLSMKKKRHYHDENTQEAKRIKPNRTLEVSSESHIGHPKSLPDLTELSRSKSLSLTRLVSLGDEISPKSSQVRKMTPVEHEIVMRSRRWTLPSKSAATRSITPLRSTVKQATLTHKAESPAMITLRRATTNKPVKRTELTFFPEPKFGNQRTGLLSYLVSTLTGNDSHNEHEGSAFLFTEVRNSQSTFMCSDGAHPTLTFPAATVCTEATVEPSLTMPGYITSKPTLRRCSTRYISGGSTYEIIWDENDTSTSSRESSRPSIPKNEITNRRPSLAIIKLEAQLSRKTSRRSSDQPSASSSGVSSRSDEMFLDRGITPEKLDRILPRLLHKSSLRDLPRSRDNGQMKWPPSNVMSGRIQDQELVESECKVSTHSIDFFPPLSSRRPSASRADWDGAGKRRGTTISITPPSPFQMRPGSLVGASSHTRRCSSALMEQLQRRSSTAAKELTGQDGDSSNEERINVSDIEPLLGKSMKRRAFRW